MKNLLTGLVIGALSSSAFATTWTVDDDGLDFPKADFDNIQAAVDAASDGDEIIVMPGTYTSTADEVVDTDGKAITIKASGTPGETIIDGEGARGVVYCHSGEGADTIIEGFTITGGSDTYGGGIRFDERSPTITGCTISDNTATSGGGGIFCRDSSSPTITGCTISDNTTTYYGGGIYCEDSSPMLTDTLVCSNLPNQITGTYSDEGGNTLAAICPVPGACCTNGECVIAEQADCLVFHGTWLGEGTTCDDAPCPTTCLGDINGDGQVSTNDLLTVIANWGPCP